MRCLDDGREELKYKPRCDYRLQNSRSKLALCATMMERTVIGIRHCCVAGRCLAFRFTNQCKRR